MSRPMNQQWVLKTRPDPDHPLEAKHFAWKEEPCPALQAGDVLLKILYISCDPTQRTWIDMDSYLPRVKIGEVMQSLGVGQIVETQNPAYPVGTLLAGLVGWQAYCKASAAALGLFERVDPSVPLDQALSVLGMTGMTAHIGLFTVGKVQAGDVVVVSGAAGATGSVAVQLAKIAGARVIGITGGEEKCAWLRSFGVEPIDYKRESVPARLKALAPAGLDLYFDNTGGPILEAVLNNLAPGARIVVCGGISAYGKSVNPGPSNYLNIIAAHARMEGFLVMGHKDKFPLARQRMAAWLASGQLKYKVDIQEGLANAPTVIGRLFTGQNLGKLLIHVTEPNG